jgi:hypothetical protein
MVTSAIAFELIMLVAVIALIVAGAVIGWERYRRGIAVVALPTTEVFIDPETGRRTRVWYDPTTGARDYRPE